jgi:hypothetical protein
MLNVLKISKIILMSGVALLFLGLCAGASIAFYNIFFGAEVTGVASFAKSMQPGWPAKTSATGLFIGMLGLVAYTASKWAIEYPDKMSGR